MESIWKALRKNNVPKIVIAIIKAPYGGAKFDIVATIENRRRWKDNAEWLEKLSLTIRPKIARLFVSHTGIFILLFNSKEKRRHEEW